MKSLFALAVLFAGLAVAGAGPQAQRAWRAIHLAGPAGVAQARPGRTQQEGAVVRGSLKDWSSTPGIAGLEAAFQYLARTDLATLPLGRTNVQGDDIYVSVSEAETRPAAQARFEAHRRYIDIQLVVKGQEAIALAPVTGLTTMEAYDAAKDIEFFAPPRESVTLALHPGEFAVFAPGDAHEPSLHLDGPHVSRKVVAKVSVAYRDQQRAGAKRNDP
jgi:YhcH/YjgK/YiaL family protein